MGSLTALVDAVVAVTEAKLEDLEVATVRSA
jgi:hypothetical protein